MPKNGANPPSERPDGKTPKGIAITLPPALAELLRLISEQTGITQGDLRKHLEGSGTVAKALETALRERYTAWRNEKLGKDLFAGLDREKEGTGG